MAKGALQSNGTAIAANKLATARTIAGVAFDGTANISIPVSNLGVYSKAEVDSRVNAKGNKNTANRSANGWWECGDTNLIIQWVRVQAGRQTWSKVTYPFAFKAHVLGYVASMASVSTGTGHTVVRNVTLSSFEYQAGTASNDETPFVHIMFWGQ
ncbi:gp53-like domain-containing protein [Photorhabdus khanii]|uniref:gp53-like domain-containing protein n=1 Tax=Photorhabdus khanii TaxID=1004150 RepID=UPI00104EFD6E|nr:hypothetical protein [Photorhabdus khanii]